MRISVVIVNFNVRYFLEQCLVSLYKAADYANRRSIAESGTGTELETWVVDNNSGDGSLQMIREKFSDVHLIANSENLGFAKANNQALRECTGDYILLLNPDTVVQSDTLYTCMQFMAQHPDCGGLSVKMINGEGKYLKESKRGFPSPATAFYKISGLIRILPHNRKVAAYYMGHLDENQTCEVDILPGAFIMLSRDTLNEVGLLDESYFMYGEDIDFSWRIHLSGRKNYYLPSTRILHYKGESTRKSSMNYVYTFYNAMAIFAKRYFSGSGGKMYNVLMQCAIWLRASLDFAKRVCGSLAVPALDFAASLAGFVTIKNLWAANWAANVNYYPSYYTWAVLPIYVLILLSTSWMAGGYDKPPRTGRMVRGMLLGTLILLLFYSLLDETLRFSRAIILVGSLWSIGASALIRTLLSILNVKGYNTRKNGNRRYLIVGSENEYKRALQLFDTTGMKTDKALRCEPSTTAQQMKQLKANEIIFCGRDIEVADMLDTTIQLAGTKTVFRTLPEGMDVFIGSNYTNSPEELYNTNSNMINTVSNRRIKRLFDIGSALVLIVLSPVLVWIQKNKRRFFHDCFAVLQGRATWVGYTNPTPKSDTSDDPLPNIRKGIFTTTDIMPQVKKPDPGRLDSLYATNYHLNYDIMTLAKNILNI